ncbi:hypothetical protein HXX76_008998 [Chlamydomonas incerta]|uniref:Ion transport domain-containing protein n=1 Tax=Chlamydomonas incerta TaxID=51695 RepID=A0A835W0Y5_CHLIN|nr:hypothetical protein HXX76_008998 [Chlamydomonas incerta]|eukprot:KAG2432071.1 hypothetical protein HXX76_008998 [Chlamydomonas incerta]
MVQGHQNGAPGPIPRLDGNGAVTGEAGHGAGAHSNGAGPGNPVQSGELGILLDDSIQFPTAGRNGMPKHTAAQVNAPPPGAHAASPGQADNGNGNDSEGEGKDKDDGKSKAKDSGADGKGQEFSFRRAAAELWADFEREIKPRKYEVLTRDVSEKSLLLFPKDNSLRRACVFIASNKLFEWFMLAIILANCVTLALATPGKPGFESTRLGINLRTCEYVWLGIFTVELLIRVIALGFIRGKGSYIRDKWNIMDFVVVGLGYLDLSGRGNYTLIRCVRVLRPLRSINKIQEMKQLVDTMLNSVPLLLDVVILAVFYYVLFGAININIFAGALMGRCGSLPMTALVHGLGGNFTGEPYGDPSAGLSLFTSMGLWDQWQVSEDNADTVCRGPVPYNLGSISWVGSCNETTGWCTWDSYTGQPKSDGGFWCSDSSQWCVPYQNPGDGYRMYDHILWAWLTMFQIMTLTDWSFSMYDCMNAINPGVFPLFWVMVVFGSFFLLNLALAVLYLQFSKDKEQKRLAAVEARREEEDRQLAEEHKKKERQARREQKRLQDKEMERIRAAQYDDLDEPLDGFDALEGGQEHARTTPGGRLQRMDASGHNLESEKTEADDFPTSKLLEGQRHAHSVPLGPDGETLRRVYEVPSFLKAAEYDEKSSCTVNELAGVSGMFSASRARDGHTGVTAGMLHGASVASRSLLGGSGHMAGHSRTGAGASGMAGASAGASAAAALNPAPGSLGSFGAGSARLSPSSSLGWSWSKDTSSGRMASLRRAALLAGNRGSSLAASRAAALEEEVDEGADARSSDSDSSGSSNADDLRQSANSGAAASTARVPAKQHPTMRRSKPGAREECPTGPSANNLIDTESIEEPPDGCCTTHIPAGKEREERYDASRSCSVLRNWCYWITSDWRLDATSMVVIAVNAIIMALQWYEMPHALDRFNDISNYAFTIYFIIEMVIKLMGLGMLYFTDGMNIMDMVVNAATTAEMIIELIPTVDNKLANTLSILRVFRLLRLFRLSRQWKSLYAITSTLLASVKQTFYLTMLLLLFMFIFSLLGMQLFGYTMAVCDSVDSSVASCPSNDLTTCPAHFDCYIPCKWQNANLVIPADGSPYDNTATCEVFPRQYAPNVTTPFSQAVARAVTALMEPATGGAELYGNMSSPELGGGNDTLAALASAYLDAVNQGSPPLDDDAFPESQPTTPYVATVNLTGVFTNLSWPYNTTLFPDLAVANLTGVDVAVGADLNDLGSSMFGPYNYTSLTYMAQVGKPSLIRSNFDNIFQGFITVFQVLTFDNWADSLHAAMHATTPWAAFFYVALILIGNFMVLNLFLAILLDNFGDIDDIVEAAEEEERAVAAAKAEAAAAEALGKVAGMGKMAAAATVGKVTGTGKEALSSMWGWLRVMVGCPPAVNEGEDKSHGRERAHGHGMDSGGEGGVSAYDGISGYSENGGGFRHRHSAGAGNGLVNNPVYHSTTPMRHSTSGANGADSYGHGHGHGAALHSASVVVPMGDPLAGVMALGGASFYVPLSRPAPLDHQRLLTADTTAIIEQEQERAARAAVVAQMAADMNATQAAMAANDNTGPSPLSRLIGAVPPTPTSTTGKQHLASVQGDKQGIPAYWSSPPRAHVHSATTNGDPTDSRDAAAGAAPSAVPMLYTLHEDGRYMFATRDFKAAQEGARYPAGLPPSVVQDAMLQMGSGLPAKAEKMRSHLDELKRRGQPEREGKGVLPPELGGGRHRGFVRPKRRTDMVLTGGSLYPVVAKPDVAMGDMMVGRSLFLFPPRNRIRCFFARIVTAKWFDTLMLIIITLSSIQLCLDTPQLDPDSKLKQALIILDYIFTIAFGIEAIMKVVVTGFMFNGPGSYVRSPWNVMDLLVVIAGVVVLITDSISNGVNIMWLRAIRTLRALRPLRAANRLGGIRTVVSAMLKAIPALGNVFMVALLIYFIFAILAINILGGKYWSCRTMDDVDTPLDPDYYLPRNITMTRDWCDANGGENITIVTSAYHTMWNLTNPPPYKINTTWNNPSTNFDNLVVALYTLFQVATLESWSDVMYTGADITQVYQQPITNNSPAVCLFFVAFVIVGGFFLLNLVIGVSIDKFNQMRRENNGGNPHMSDEQEAWVSTQKMLTNLRALRRHVPPESKFRAFFYHLTQNQIFEDVIMVIVVISIGFMLLVHADMASTFSYIVSYSNLAFTAIFLVEMLLKWIALGIRGYYKSGWNCFDCLVVCAGIAGVIVDFATDTVFTFFPIIRALRVLRLFRLIPRFKGLRTLLTTLWWSLPALINVGSVLFLLLFVYAIIGMNLFGMIREDNAGELGQYVSFRNFPLAFLTLFRLMTGENWNGVMEDCMQLDQCVRIDQTWYPTTNSQDPDPNDPGAVVLSPGDYYDFDDPVLAGVPQDYKTNQCSPHPLVAVIYFFSYILIITFMLLQMIIGIIIDNIQNTAFQEKLPVGPSSLHTFTEVWEDLDPHGSGFIPASALTSLLLRLPKPLGVKKLDSQMLRVQEIVLSTNIPIRNRCVQFYEVLHALTGRAAGTDVPTDQEDPLHDQLIPHIPPDFDGAPTHNAAQYYSAMYMTTAVRRLLLQDWTERKLNELREIKTRLKTLKDAAKAAGEAGGLNEERFELEREAQVIAEEVRERMRDAAETLGGDAGKTKRRKRLGGVVKSFVKSKMIKGKSTKSRRDKDNKNAAEEQGVPLRQRSMERNGSARRDGKGFAAAAAATMAAAKLGSLKELQASAGATGTAAAAAVRRAVPARVAMAALGSLMAAGRNAGASEPPVASNSASGAVTHRRPEPSVASSSAADVTPAAVDHVVVEMTPRPQ